MLPRIKVRDSVVTVDEKPYNISELLIQGRVTGSIKFNKSHGLAGDLIVETSKIFYEYPGILVIGELSKPLNYGIEIRESKKGLTVKTKNIDSLSVYEVNIVFEGTPITLMMSTMPRRLSIAVHEAATTSIVEKFMALEIIVKSHEEVVEAKVTQVFSG